MPRPRASQPDLFGQATPPPPAPAIAAPLTADGDLRAANAWFTFYLRAHGYSDNTVAAYTTAVESLARHLVRPMALRRVTPGHLRRYVRWVATQAEHVPPTTVATRVTGLRRFFRALAEAGILGADPAADLRLPREPRRLPGILAESDVALLRREARHQLERDSEAGSLELLLLALMLDLGMRRSEIEALTAQHVVPRQHGYEITIRHPRRSHRYQNRALTAPPDFADVYHAYRINNAPRDDLLVATPRRSLYRVVARLGDRAGLAFTLTPSALRWTCARRWFETQPPAETQRLLGLSPIGWQHAEEVLRSLRPGRE